MSDRVITRFAPSPTGLLHVGSARTALFNWLFAKHHGGKMLLRIEDTDRKRFTQKRVDAIRRDLQWLRIEWHGKPISQYSRIRHHAEVGRKLLESGEAYRCYATPKELTEMREKARAEGRAPRYDRLWRDRSPEEAPHGVNPVIRIKAPRDGQTIVDDKIQGIVRFPNKDLDDFVVLRSDGTPTYMLAAVVDDHDMGVTHIIRGDDHLTNAARQSLIYRAMDWKIPVMAHIPLIHSPNGAKLSKRHQAVGADIPYYRNAGILPEALCNYLVRLGWAHGDDEIMSRAQMIEWFGFEGMSKSAARFDSVKLEALNGHYIRNAQDEDLLERLLEVIESPVNEIQRQCLLSLMPSLKERAKTLVEMAKSVGFLFTKCHLRPDADAKALLEAGGELLPEAVKALDSLPSPWSAESTEAKIRELAEARGLKLGAIAQPLRAALTGSKVSPPIFDVLTALGKKESLKRIRDGLKQVKKPSAGAERKSSGHVVGLLRLASSKTKTAEFAQ